MNIISDLHIHSRFSRATSKTLDIDNLQKYALIKGVDLLGTGDFTHPEWIKELKQKLTDDGTGILRTKQGFPFILQTELSLIYTHEGKGRKVHLVILARDFDTVSQITEYLLKKGRIDYDGRPIFGIPCPEFVEAIRGIDNKIEVIPAHCLLPDTFIQTNPGIKQINSVKKEDKVLTHKGRFRKIKKIYTRPYKGRLVHIQPWYFTLGLKTTPEHPFFAIKTIKKCSDTKGTCRVTCSKTPKCKRRYFEGYNPMWIPASQLEVGDVLLYPRTTQIKDLAEIKVIDKKIKVDLDFCWLAGFYLAEGYTNSRDGIGFSFNKSEKDELKKIITIISKLFGLEPKKAKSSGDGKDIIFYSKKLMKFFRDNFYRGDLKRALNKAMPDWMLKLPFEKQVELLKGWWNGDKGYTVSRILANQMKLICLRIGIIPSIGLDSAENHKRRGKHKIGDRIIKANHDIYHFSNLSFFEDKFKLLEDNLFKKYKTKRITRHGWMDKNYAYVPLRKITNPNYEGIVYNLEVEQDNSYASEFAVVHNCWTPWFSLFGSNSGFDSVKECFQDQTKHIHALETGLSSDPEMNWRLSQLDKYSLVSFSDLHSYWPWRLGREATVFDIKLTYDNLIKAIRTKQGLKETIEVDPSYGKYHFTGHRNCNICLNPKQALKLNDICPNCKKKLTVGVLQRVEALADRPEGFKPKDAKPFRRLIPLSEILSKLVGKAIATQAVWKEYNNLIANFKSEYNILLNAEENELKKFTNAKIAEAIIKNRQGKIEVKPGFDGEYGIPVFSKEDKKAAEKKLKQKQTSLGEF